MTEKLESIDWHGNVAQGMLDAMVHGYIYALMNATEAPARIIMALLGRCSNYIAEVCGAYRNKVPYRRRLRDNVLFYGPTSLLFRSATLLLRQGALPPLDGDLSNVGLISTVATISDVFSRWAAEYAIKLAAMLKGTSALPAEILMIVTNSPTREMDPKAAGLYLTILLTFFAINNMNNRLVLIVPEIHEIFRGLKWFVL